MKLPENNPWRNFCNLLTFQANPIQDGCHNPPTLETTTKCYDSVTFTDIQLKYVDESHVQNVPHLFLFVQKFCLKQATNVGVNPVCSKTVL